MSFGTKGCMYCEGECNKECLPKQESHICKYCNAETTQPDDECYAKHKQETLEEAAERFIPDNYIKVAPKQKVNAAEITRHYFREGAKWQAERMYSEEEVKEIVEKTIEKFYKHNYTLTKAEMKEQWFENFKKK
jgi:hypothetical protein